MGRFRVIYVILILGILPERNQEFIQLLIPKVGSVD